MANLVLRAFASLTFSDREDFLTALLRVHGQPRLTITPWESPTDVQTRFTHWLVDEFETIDLDQIRRCWDVYGVFMEHSVADPGLGAWAEGSVEFTARPAPADSSYSSTPFSSPDERRHFFEDTVLRRAILKNSIVSYVLGGHRRISGSLKGIFASLTTPTSGPTILYLLGYPAPAEIHTEWCKRLDLPETASQAEVLEQYYLRHNDAAIAGFNPAALQCD